MTHNDSTKRSFLVRTLGATLSVPIITMAHAKSIDGEPDHELLALSAQIDALWPELQATQEASLAAAHAADEEISRRLGFDSRTRGGFLTPEECSKASEMMKVVWGELRTDDVHNKCSEVWARADGVHQKIIATPARTVAGFAIKARAAAMLTASNLWDEPASDLDWDKHVIRSLIEALCAAAGMPLPFDDVGAG
jgi:hypothetical protein